MDTPTFVSNIISSIIWPLTVIAIIVILRGSVQDLIAALGRRIRNLKFPGGEASFSDELSEIKEAADEANLPPGEPAVSERAVSAISEKSRWQSLANSYPEAAVMEAWREIEIVMRDIAQTLDVSDKEIHSPLMLIRALGKHEIIDSDTLTIISNLRGIRNSVTHAHGREVDLSRSDANNYVVLAQRVIAKLHSLLPP